MIFDSQRFAALQSGLSWRLDAEVVKVTNRETQCSATFGALDLSHSSAHV